MRLSTWITLTAGLALGFCLCLSPEARAISAFARQYQAECSTCHAPFPRRNAFGEAFRKNGYVWPGGEGAVSTDLAEYLDLSGLTENIPLAVSLRHTLAYDPDEEDDKLSPNTEAQLHLGGAIKDVVGFFAHDLTGSGEAFALFRRVAKTPLNVKYGRFIPQTSLWKPDQILTGTALATQGMTVAGEPALGTPRDGLELNAILGSRLFLAGGVADRGNQDRMEYYGHASYKIEGTDFEGEEPDLDFDAEGSVWDYLTVTLGGYGLFGQTESTGNDYYRAGVEVEVRYQGLTVLLGALTADDDDADGNGLEVDSVVYQVQADYYFSSTYLLLGRFEYEDVGNAADGINRRGIAAFHWNPILNLLFRVEGVYEKTDAAEDDTHTSGSVLVTLHL